MKKLFLLSNLLLFVFTKAISQNNLPPVYEITTDTAAHNPLPNEYWQILEDKDGKLSFEEVSKQPLANKFHYTKKFSNYDITVHAYWFRFVLKNTMNANAKICFENSIRNVNEQSDFYFITRDGKIIHQLNGISTPWSKLTGLKEYRIIPVELEPGEQIIICQRIYNTYHFFRPNYDSTVAFSSTEKTMRQIYGFSQTQYFNAIHDIFIVGVLAFAGVFIFLFFIIIKEKVYLYFSLYLFSLSIGRFNTKFEMFDVFFREHPYLFNYIYGGIWFFSIFFLTHFIRYLLNTKQYLPRWDKFLVVSNIIYAVTNLIALAIQFTSASNFILYAITIIEQIILALSIIVSFFLCVKWFKTNKVLTYIVLPLQSIWSITWSIAIFSLTFNINTIIWLQTNWSGVETILLCCLVVSFSWILLNRFGELKKQVIQKELEKEIERSRLIENQKIELEEQVANRTAELKQSFENLKSTQSQLIQSEKMASLGELTAGIAHEIQNPLNFVNNFSEVNKELIEELQEERHKEQGARDEKLENEILSDIKENEEKINHHGKRADAIVKGMLQHSRTSTGVKEPTDINALADEYLRLSYHGLRAKDKDFNAEIKTDFDNAIGKINIIPQDIGRVLLNLYNNAFYAVNEKKKAQSGYEPIVSVSTKGSLSFGEGHGEVLIKVSDNGNGIPQKAIDKIFQPFFTTKPTGQGTGLGLSLSYDIVKAHGGEIKVETKEGEETTFTIQLPTA